MDTIEVSKLLVSALLGGLGGAYLKDYFERRKRSEDRQRLRRALHKDLTAIFALLVRIHENIFHDVDPVVTDITSWTERKRWIPPLLKSLAFTHSEKDVLLFLEIKEAEVLNRTFVGFSTFMDDDQDDRLRFSLKLQMACRYFETQFKENRINQELVLEFATERMRNRLMELKEGKRLSVDEFANQELSRYDPGELSWWWATFESPAPRDEPILPAPPLRDGE